MTGWIAIRIMLVFVLAACGWPVALLFLGN